MEYIQTKSNIDGEKICRYISSDEILELFIFEKEEIYKVSYIDCKNLSYGNISKKIAKKLKDKYIQLNQTSYIHISKINYFTISSKKEYKIKVAYSIEQIIFSPIVLDNNFVEVETPVSTLYHEKCYINTKNIKYIQEENYLTITPEEIDMYLKENKINSSYLYYIYFKDMTCLTILENSLEKLGDYFE